MKYDCQYLGNSVRFQALAADKCFETVTINNLLEINELYCAYQDQAMVLNGISFSLQAGKQYCLLGPSGCGKSTLLRCIAGFEPVQQGSILLRGKEVSAPQTNIAPEHRHIGLVPQDFALFPHLNVQQNICFGIQKLSQTEQAARLTELLELVRLQGYEQQYPHELSGGQQQRVAIARAIANKPDLILFDEPFSSLDHALTQKLCQEIKTILSLTGVTALFVTHNQAEAFYLADEIGLMMHGKLAQWGTAKQLYQQPNTAEIANFLGAGFLLPAQVTNNQIVTAIGAFANDKAYAEGSNCQLLLRSECLAEDPNGHIQAKIKHVYFQGDKQVAEVFLTDQPDIQFKCQLPADKAFCPEQSLKLKLNVNNLHSLT